MIPGTYRTYQATSTTQDAERMKFTGHERDLRDPSNTTDDLDYMHARYYNPNLGRLLSPDLLRGNPYQPQSFHLYAYVQNNPITYVDPFGLYWNQEGKWQEDIIVAGGSGDYWAWQHNPLNILLFGGWYGGSGGGGGSARPTSTATPQQPCSTSGFGGGVGIMVGATGDAQALLAGAPASLSGGGGLFYDATSGLSGGLFATGGALAYLGGSVAATPPQTADGKALRPGGLGAYAGGGASIFVTNARSVQQLSGHFETWAGNIGWGLSKFSLTIAASGTVGMIAIGPPYAGVSASGSLTRYVTDTSTQQRGCR